MRAKLTNSTYCKDTCSPISVCVKGLVEFARYTADHRFQSRGRGLPRPPVASRGLLLPPGASHELLCVLFLCACFRCFASLVFLALLDLNALLDLLPVLLDACIVLLCILILMILLCLLCLRCLRCLRCLFVFVNVVSCCVFAWLLLFAVLA